MGIVYFDICSIPLFLIILFICHSRKMTKGKTNRLFILLVFISLLSGIADLSLEVTNNMAPLSPTGVIICNISIYTYLALRNATNAILLLFLLALTQTTFLLRKRHVQLFFCLPYACILAILIQNPFTQSAFTVTAESAYARGPLMLAFYGIATIYGIVGLAYCIYCRRYLPKKNWNALLCAYILVHLAVLIQFFYPKMLVEMFCTAVAELLAMLSIMRPEERMDSAAGMLSWASYQSDLRNIILSGEHVQILAIRLTNSQEIRNYLGDYSFNEYLTSLADGIRAIHWQRQYRIELYYERPGFIYLITDADEPGTENLRERLLTESGDSIKRFADMGARFVPQICLIRCPDDLRSADDIISLGHIFHKFDNRRQIVFHAADIVHSKSFSIEAHIKEILDRAIRDNHIEMYYQPIYDVHSGSFRSAEALARIIDPEYGLISPAIFIPAAETEGFIIPVGDVALEQVFRFISEHDLDALGLSYIEVNLSVAQCMNSSLIEKIHALQQKYGVDPSRVNLEITETTFENINEIMVENVNKLIQMGYSFALDDYGIGYSSIQRVNHIPLKLIKIDKSMLEEVSSINGRMILEHTVNMMQSIGKKLVAEGAETLDEVDILKTANCDYIQGFYFCQPLPAAEFTRFLAEHNRPVQP
ncbi:MAG: EAL domain-containing protein [Clostridia bacterium]|nr:EAL domain-containing protein [Clostridia bacterium]